MSLEPFPVYRHSGKFGIHGPLLALIAAVALGLPLGIAYAYVIKWCPFIYINFFATVGYGLAFGFMTGWLLKIGKVRNTSIAVLTGLVAGVIACYFNWNGHVYALFKSAYIFNFPDTILAAVKLLYEHGSWGMRSSGNVTGIPLAIVWLVEAGIIIGLATFTSVGMVTDVPFCEKNRCWLDQEKKISTLQPFTDPEHIAALKAGDLAPFAHAKVKEPGANAFARLTLKHSPRTREFCTVRVENITLRADKDGETKEEAEKLTGNLMVPTATFDLIAKFEKFGETTETAVA